MLHILYYVLGLFDKTFDNKKLKDLTCYVHNYMEAHSQQIEKQGNNRLNVGLSKCLVCFCKLSLQENFRGKKFQFGAPFINVVSIKLL